jgi:hypothetical protein
MNILGIGPLELVVIFLIILLIIGPKDTVSTGRTIGRWLRTIISSDTWRIIRDTSKEIRNIPTKLVRDAGMNDLNNVIPSENEIRKSIGYDELAKDINTINAGVSDWTTPSNQPAPKPNQNPLPQTSVASQSNTIKKSSPPPDNDWSSPRKRVKKVVDIPPEKSTDNQDNNQEILQSTSVPDSTDENKS